MAMDASPLAKLPAELRNMVYHEVLRQEGPIILLFNQLDETEEIPKVRLKLPKIIRASLFAPSSPSSFYDDIDGWNPVCYWDDTPRGRLERIERMRNMMSLTATCKPLRQETRDLFFAINSFEIEVTRSEGERPLFSRDTASGPVESLLEHISTGSAISAVKSITLDLSYAWSWPENSAPLYDMITGLNNEFLKRFPGLPLRVKAHCGMWENFDAKELDVYIEMRNLASSIEFALEQLRRWHQEELESRSSSLDCEFCQDEFDIITSQLEACLPQVAATEEV
ncbi:hypothetical protein KC351_g14599 [Hortaea werneckii]|nr:hypothetical protein KC351_g14599 [Hortaea werneckii]